MSLEQDVRRNRVPLCAAFLLLLGAARQASAGELVSLEAALREARAANAHLPLPALDISIASEREKEARAEQWLKVALEGDFVYAPPGYAVPLTNLGNARLQAVVRQPIYAGGSLKAAVDRAGAGAEAARGRYRMVEKDLELEVRSRFSELLEIDSEASIRRAGLEDLDGYRTSLRSRQASGQGIAADLLKTEVRLTLEEATLAEVEQRRDDARLSLNELMGRDPASPLELEPLPIPEAPRDAAPAAWQNAPEVRVAKAAARSAEADTVIATAERRPHLFFSADAGFWTDDTTHLNSRFWDRFWHDAGYSFALVFVWNIWDPGAARSRIAQASLGLQQSRLQLEVGRRDARLAWEKAHTALAHIYKQIEILSRAVPDARDSYLDAQSRYRGGAATALEVLDAHAAAVEAAVRRSDAIARYRVADAVSLRWGTP
jgi:outer membrane protein TolC